jgi:hypothetical protein
MVERTPTSSSPEAEILRQIEELIRKLAAGSASQNDMQMLQDLQRVRVDLMRPKVFSRDEAGNEAAPIRMMA